VAAPEAADWYAFELEPERAADYAAQDDLLFCSTRLPELKKCYLRGEPFFSGRFCNSGALFAFLKFESTGVSPEERLAERARFEDALQHSLADTQGGLVGVGLGLRYGYVDVALSDPECVVDRVLPSLRSARVSKRSWILFCDSELAAECVPIYADSPAPP
jgi:hypothetical protein